MPPTLAGTVFEECVVRSFQHWDVLRTILDADVAGEHSEGVRPLVAWFALVNMSQRRPSGCPR